MTIRAFSFLLTLAGVAAFLVGATLLMDHNMGRSGEFAGFAGAMLCLYGPAAWVGGILLAIGSRLRKFS